MEITLGGDLEQLVSERVASGRYRSPDEVVRAALLLLRRADQDRSERLAQLRDEIAVGLAAAERGDVLDGEAVMASLLQRAQRQQ